MLEKGKKIQLVKDTFIMRNWRMIPKDSKGVITSKTGSKYWYQVHFNLGETFNVKVLVHIDWMIEC